MCRMLLFLERLPKGRLSQLDLPSIILILPLQVGFLGSIVKASLLHNANRLMTVAGQIKKGAYFDSVTLMRVGKELAGLPGVADAAVVMGTKSNRAILHASGLLIPKFSGAGDTDLLIAVKAGTAKAAEAALAAADGLLRKATRKAAAGTEVRPVSLDGALTGPAGGQSGADFVAGRYAGDVAMRALERGLHVMLFSDNVPLEQEIALKQFARKRGLLVMGPDCGTAIINGVPLAFANAVNRGSIGIVAAAGTGLQEVSCIISNAGAGISQAIGTGGRDVKQEVGGIMFIEALKALAKDEQTRVILLVSKPPHPQVLRRIERGDQDDPQAGRHPVHRRAERRPGHRQHWKKRRCRRWRWRRARNPTPWRNSWLRETRTCASWRSARRPGGKGRKYVRGLFSGGTFCAEAQIILRGHAAGGVFECARPGREATPELPGEPGAYAD